jgi:hypothetical protein
MRSKPFQPFLEILMKAGLVIVDENTGCIIQWIALFS